jgi:Glycosyl transferase family 2
VTPSSNYQLAVIIPAYKPDFLARALTCLARQTDQRFAIYICDDASPADIQGISRSVLGSRPFVFKRFEKNLGGVSLPRHWDRCVAESTEPWFWLFSDDDLMDDGCTAAFHKLFEVEKVSSDLLRFNGWLVDEGDRVMGPNGFEPERELWLEYAYGHLMGWRRVFLQQLVFRRSAFERTGGFVDLPLGFAADDAAVIGLTRRQPARIISGAKVYWRSSRKNLTLDRSVGKRAEKLRAVVLFLQWLQEQLRAPREHLFENDQAAFLQAMDLYLMQQVLIHGARPALANWGLLSRTRAALGNKSRFALLRYIVVAGVKDGIAAAGRPVGRLTGRPG